MTAATQRIPVLVTPAEKEQIAKMARGAGLSMGEFLRRAAMAFQPGEDEKLLESMIEQMSKTTTRAHLAIDEALASVAASNNRIDAMERQAQLRRAA